MGIYEKHQYKNVTEEFKQKKLDDYDQIASAVIYFNSEGNFALETQASYKLAFIANAAGKTNEEIEKVVDETLQKGANELIDFLESCYKKAIENFIKSLAEETGGEASYE